MPGIIKNHSSIPPSFPLNKMVKIPKFVPQFSKFNDEFQRGETLSQFLFSGCRQREQTFLLSDAFLYFKGEKGSFLALGQKKKSFFRLAEEPLYRSQDVVHLPPPWIFHSFYILSWNAIISFIWEHHNLINNNLHLQTRGRIISDPHEDLILKMDSIFFSSRNVE